MTSDDHHAESLIETIRSLCRSVAARDVEALLAHFSDDCVFADGTSGQQAGSEGLLRFLDEMWTLFPDFTPRVAAAHVQGDTVGALFDSSGTLADPVAPGSTSRAVRWMTVGFSTFDGQTGKIIRDVYFADMEAMTHAMAGPTAPPPS